MGPQFCGYRPALPRLHKVRAAYWFLRKYINSINFIDVLQYSNSINDPGLCTPVLCTPKLVKIVDRGFAAFTGLKRSGRNCLVDQLLVVLETCMFTLNFVVVLSFSSPFLTTFSLRLFLNDLLSPSKDFRLTCVRFPNHVLFGHLVFDELSFERLDRIRLS